MHAFRRLPRAAALAVCVVVATVAAPVALGGLQRAGKLYDGIGTHSVGGGTGIEFSFKVSRNGRRVQALTLGLMNAVCAHHGGIADPSLNTSVASGPIHGSHFAVTVHSTTGGAPVHLSGRFTSGGHAVGTVSWHGTGSESACATFQHWKAHLRPPPPRRIHFVGTTAHGQHVGLDRTVEHTSHAENFKFGQITATCTDGSTEIKPANSNGVLRIHSGGTFSGDGFTRNGEAITVTGRFTSPTQVSGKFTVIGRDDCSGSDHFTAHRS
ncbi:MAG: hypothetical protein M3Z27_06900 [Actinomycetota bacterium]|nr:hypothetical protein [Actinomycetota bacterium]